MKSEQVYTKAFDEDFFRLPQAVQNRIQTKIDEMGERLDEFSHHHLVGCDEFRLRIGDYRVIYSFDLTTNRIFMIAVGHRREIYR